MKECSNKAQSNTPRVYNTLGHELRLPQGKKAQFVTVMGILAAMDTLSGAVERITYYNPENGYTVLRLRPDEKLSHRFANRSNLNAEGLATVVGTLPELSPGEHLRLQGQWDNHPKHGPQFKAEVCEQTLPATVAGIQGYLGSGMIKGIGPKFAERIVDRFKEETFEVIESAPQRLLEVPGIGEERVRKITAAWKEQKQVKEIMVFLHGHGVSTNLAVKIYKTYGDTAHLFDPVVFRREECRGAITRLGGCRLHSYLAISRYCLPYPSQK